MFTGHAKALVERTIQARSDGAWSAFITQPNYQQNARAELEFLLIDDVGLNIQIDLAARRVPVGTNSLIATEENVLVEPQEHFDTALQPLSRETYEAIFGATETRTDLFMALLAPLSPMQNFVARALGVFDDVMRRVDAHRDHGAVATIQEECIRSFKIGNAAWDSMKADTAASVQPTEKACGTALIGAIARRENDKTKAPLSKVTIVAHSAGSILACHLLRLADEQGIKQRFNVVFLAPAVTHSFFAETIRLHGSVINKFRLFTMRDHFEQLDGVPSRRLALYEHSLLYLVSGSFETRPVDETNIRGDVPILGMRRFAEMSGDLSASESADVSFVENYLAKPTQKGFWSVTGKHTPIGEVTRSKTHGGFPEDPGTKRSVLEFICTA
ncbi:alpha/beta hydrolase [Cryobacterium serini]|nr:alpha/beta hydrolase [Cryobacterium serini]